MSLPIHRGPNCFVNGILENKEYYFDIASGNWIAQQIIEDTVKDIKETYSSTVRKIDEEKILESFNKFMSALQNK